MMTIFNKNKKSKQEIFWVIEENEDNLNTTLVKFYNQNDQLLHQEILIGLQKDILDTNALQKIKKISQKALRKVA